MIATEDKLVYKYYIIKDKYNCCDYAKESVNKKENLFDKYTMDLNKFTLEDIKEVTREEYKQFLNNLKKNK